MGVPVESLAADGLRYAPAYQMKFIIWTGLTPMVTGWNFPYALQ